MCGTPPFCALIGIYVIPGKPTQNNTNNTANNNHVQYNCNGNDVDSQSFIQKSLKYYLIMFPPSLKTPTHSQCHWSSTSFISRERSQLKWCQPWVWINHLNSVKHCWIIDPPFGNYNQYMYLISNSVAMSISYLKNTFSTLY